MKIRIIHDEKYQVFSASFAICPSVWPALLVIWALMKISEKNCRPTQIGVILKIPTAAVFKQLLTQTVDKSPVLQTPWLSEVADYCSCSLTFIFIKCMCLIVIFKLIALCFTYLNWHFNFYMDCFQRFLISNLCLISYTLNF